VVRSAGQPDRRPRARPSCARRSRTTRSLVASGELVEGAQASRTPPVARSRRLPNR
jgi:hypothetical protein